MSSHPLILTLDQYGVPHRWVSWQHACIYVARDLVAWDAGDTHFIFYGGTNRVTGERSELATSSIIAIRGKALSGKSLHPTPPLSNRELFHRDRHICANATYQPSDNCYTPVLRGFLTCNSFQPKNGRPAQKSHPLAGPIVTRRPYNIRSLVQGRRP